MTDEAVKDLLQRIPYGFYGITSRSGDEVNAMVANWITQASYEPRLIVLALQRSSFTYRLVSEGGVFTLNLFNRENEEFIKPFTKSRAKNPDKMVGIDYSIAPLTECPILPGVFGYIECEVRDIFTSGGDHDLVLGEVVGGEVLKPGTVDDTLTLMDLGWSYAG